MKSATFCYKTNMKRINNMENMKGIRNEALKFQPGNKI